MDLKDLTFLQPQPPFETCPMCGDEQFGVSSVEGRTCKRMCRQCEYHEGRTLPAITKRLVYLDQSAISKILHTYRPDTRRNPDQEVDPFWAEVAERIFRLGAWQFISCPSTLIHLQESIVDNRIFRPLQRIYKYLNFGVSVLFEARVQALQIGKGFRNFLAGNDELIGTPTGDIAWGLHDWQGKWRVLPQVPDDPIEASGFRKRKTVVARDINALFETWAKEQSISFDERCEKEAAAVGEMSEDLINRFFSDHPDVHQYVVGNRRIPPGIPANVLAFETRAILQALLDESGAAGLSTAEGLVRAAEFLRSGACRRLPANRLSGLLYAMLAHQAKNTRKKPLSPGMGNDVWFISYYLPYMDAMFLDNECRGLLTDKLVASRHSFNTKLFSFSNKADFLTYLDEIHTSASSEHLKAARDVYGDYYLTPDALLGSESPIVGLPPGSIPVEGSLTRARSPC
jgi:hypothetical protein